MPGIFNTDQGAQSTDADFSSKLAAPGIAISMDGKGRWIGNVFIEQLWRTVKYEDVYRSAYDCVPTPAPKLPKVSLTSFDDPGPRLFLYQRRSAQLIVGKLYTARPWARVLIAQAIDLHRFEFSGTSIACKHLGVGLSRSLSTTTVTSTVNSTRHSN